jgi:hypothetical protein
VADLNAGGTVTPKGGNLLTELAFGIVGDTRPPSKDDLQSYPTSIITKIWQDVAAEVPSLPFVLTTGDYVFASPNGTSAAPQFDLYLGARAAFSGQVFAALGNHECTGFTASNCGPGSKDGAPVNYTTFLDKMVKPLGVDVPWYRVQYAAQDGSWTAKVVVIAANAWNPQQESWLEAALTEPTTYTFVVRHESSFAQNAPGVAPSQAIVARHPLTMLIAGHTHTYEHHQGSREVIVGHGGAPLTSSVNYGYVVARRQADASVRFTAYDYQSHAVVDTFAVHADGSPAP